MRCKNCGADNDDNRYICEVCGSPLYDESDFDNANGIDNDRTQTFKAVNEPNNQVQNRNDNYNDYDKEIHLYIYCHIRNFSGSIVLFT